MSAGFSVDLAALRNAAEGVTDTVDLLANRKISDIDADKSNFGHDDLGATVSDFCERWQRGVAHLTEDANEFATRLIDSVNAYSHVERTTKDHLGDILARAVGPDPAAE